MVTRSAGRAGKRRDGHFAATKVVNHGGDLSLAIQFRLQFLDRCFSLSYDFFILSTKEFQ